MENIEHKSAEAINGVLRDHQANVSDWCFSNSAKTLHIWTKMMLLDFKIESDGIPALLVEPLRKRLGHYKSGRNGFALNDEIAIDQNCLQTFPLWQVLGILAHELIHLWQKHNGNPPAPNSRNYHNKQYCQKAREIGLLVDQAGHTKYALGNTLFRSLLKKNGVEVPAVFEPVSQFHKSKSSLRLYECSCGVKVRIGQSRFNALCLDCGTPFVDKKCLVI